MVQNLLLKFFWDSTILNKCGILILEFSKKQEKKASEKKAAKKSNEKNTRKLYGNFGSNATGCLV